MSRRTAWAVALSGGLAVLAVASVAWVASIDDDRVTPAVVRDFTTGVVEVTASAGAIIWGAWYWVGKRGNGRGRR
jgi:hypothetical protein